MTSLGRSLNSLENLTIIGNVVEKQSKNLDEKDNVNNRKKMIALENRLGTSRGKIIIKKALLIKTER